MAFSNKKLPTREVVKLLLPKIIFNKVRSTTEQKSNRDRECFATGEKIKKGEFYINHQFKYDKRIITISFSMDFFYG